MNLKSVRDKLSKRKLGIIEYFGTAFDVFRVILKENIWLVLFVFLIIGTRVLIGGLKYKYMINIDYFNISEAQFDTIMMLEKVFNILDFIIFIITVIFSGYFYRIIALKIEDRENEIYSKGFFFKMLNLTGLIILETVVLLFFGILGMLGAAIGMFCIVMTLCLSVGMLLYFEVYCIRDIGFMDSADYSFQLCDKNRLRKIIPSIILGIGIMTDFYYIVLQIFIKNVPNKILISAIMAVILTFIGIYVYILDTVIFLNVEYNYFKNHENSQFNFINEKEKKSKENHQILDKFLSNNKNESVEKTDKNKK